MARRTKTSEVHSSASVGQSIAQMSRSGSGSVEGRSGPASAASAVGGGAPPRKLIGFQDPAHRHVAPKGNQYAAGPHKNVSGKSNFVTQQLIAKLNDKCPRKLASYKDQRYYAKLVDTIVDMAVNKNLDAIRFIWERVEGRVPHQINAKVEHEHRLNEALDTLSDEELDQLEKLSRKMLEGQGIEVIDIEAEKIEATPK